MKVKNIIKIYATVILLVMQSCSDFVDVVPDNIAVIEDAFATRLSSQRFLATLYGYLPGKVGGGGRFPADPSLISGDEIWLNEGIRAPLGNPIAGPRIITGGQNVLSPLLGAWGNSGGPNLFIALRDCNIFLDNIDKPFNLPDYEKQVWVAEAKFLKAYYHFYLMRMYGPIPLVKKNIEVSSGLNAVRVSRDPVDEVGAYIVALLEEAISDLPYVVQNPELELGRATKVVAAALKAKVLTTLASPLFNGNTDYSSFKDAEGNALVSTDFSPEKWEAARDACLEAIEIANIAGNVLYTTIAPLSDWSIETKTKMDIRGSISEPWNKELIWGRSDENTSGLQAASRPKLDIRSRLSTGANAYWAPTMRVAEMFYSKNGVPIEEDKDYAYSERFSIKVAGADHKNYIEEGFATPGLHLDREPRFYASLGFDGGVWLEDQNGGALVESAAHIVHAKLGEYAANNGPGFSWSETGYFAKKLSHPKNFLPAQGGLSTIRYPFPVLRLADIYLLYAETLNETDNRSEAQVWLNKVRTRAGLSDVATAWADYSINPTKPSTKEGLREIIQQERMIELVFEGKRFWDLRRWKRASEFMNKDIRGWNRFGEDTEEYYKIITFATPKFLTKNYLWPISEQDIIRNPNLIQNPGW